MYINTYIKHMYVIAINETEAMILKRARRPIWKGLEGGM